MLAALTIGFPMRSDARTILAAVPISRMDLPWWRARHEAKLQALARVHPTLIFLGDSITQDWEKSGPPAWRDFAPDWQRFYGDRNAVNLGFIGDTTANLLWRIRNGEVAGIAPKVAVLLIGANNLGRVHWSAADTVAGIDTIITELRHRLPQTRILLLGVLPSARSAWVSETTRQINTQLASRYKDVPSVTYLDLTVIFMRNGMLNRALYLDPRLTPPDPPLHPSAEGQRLMSRTMEPVLAEMLGDRPH
ncbi:GDSL-type esterase/lipase family protein [Rhodopila sp.]|uniref:GDSL-type esterase/lipase family protein n=1 Tax=Rhodopila sp. TaxID=2480087 RepID=UPI003D0A58B8